MLAGPGSVWRVTTRAGHQLHAIEREPEVGRSGCDVLLVHGLASNARLWDDVAELLAAAGHRTVAVDQRAHGHSERAEAGFDWPGVAADLQDVIAALELERPVAVGQSWGGNVVLELAASQPTAVRGVMCVDGGFFDLQARFADADAAWEQLQPPSWEGVTHREVVAHMTARFAGWPPAALRGQLANFTRTPDGSAQPALRRADHELVVRAMWEQRPAEVAARTTVPVLLGPVADGADPDAERLAQVDAVAAALPNGCVHWFASAEHDVHAHRPQDVTDVLRAAIDDGFLA